MKVFNYDRETGVYLGESEADESPLEPGKYLVPAYAVTVAPPDEIAMGNAAFWRVDHWEVAAVPFKDDNLDHVQDAPEGFEPEPEPVAPEKVGLFRRIIKAVIG